MSFRVSVAHEAEKILDRLDRPTDSVFALALGNLLSTHSIHASPRPSPRGPEFASPALVAGAFCSLWIGRPKWSISSLLIPAARSTNTHDDLVGEVQ